MAVTLISDGVDSHHLYTGLIHSIKNLLGEDWEVEILHTLYEENPCADWLAKEGARDVILMKLWHTPPSEISLLLLGDATGASFMRMWSFLLLSCLLLSKHKKKYTYIFRRTFHKKLFFYRLNKHIINLVNIICAIAKLSVCFFLHS